jgi:RNA recognition motif-containing protein
VFVNNFPYTAKSGEVLSFRMLFDSLGGVRGMALVQFAVTEAADDAIRRLNGSEFGGRTLNVEYSTQSDEVPRGRQRSPKRRDDRRGDLLTTRDIRHMECRHIIMMMGIGTGEGHRRPIIRLIRMNPREDREKIEWDTERGIR